MASGKPGLEQRTRRGQQEVWNGDGGREEFDDSEGRVEGARRFPGCSRQYGKECEAEGEQEQVDDSLGSRAEESGGGVRVGVSGEQVS